MLMQKGANFSVVSTTLLIDLTSNFTQSPQSSTKPILCYLTNFLKTITYSPEFKFHRNPMWGTCKIDLIHDAQHLCTCLRTDGIKVMANGFLGGKQLIKYNQYKKSRSSLFILDHRKWTTFYDDGKLWVEVIIFSFFGCRSDRRFPKSKQ